MEFTCNTKRLLAAVTACCRVARKNVKPVLECISINASGGELNLYATDLERSLSLTIAAEVHSEGETLVSAQQIRAALSQETGETIGLAVTASHVELRGENSTVKWGIRSDLAPKPHEHGKANSFTVPCAVIVAAMRGTAWTTDEASNRFALGGVLLDCEVGELNFVATDTKAMAVYGPIATKCEKFQAIIPSPSCGALIAVLPDDGDCEISISNNDVRFTFDGGWISSRQLEGRFPRWRDIFRESSQINIEMPAGILSGVVNKCLLVRVDGDDKAKIERQVGTEFHFGNGKLLAKSVTTAGESQAEAIIPECEPIEIHFDSDYLHDVLRAMNPSENVAIALQDYSSGGFFSQGNLRCVVMPMNTER